MSCTVNHVIITILCRGADGQIDDQIVDINRLIGHTLDTNSHLLGFIIERIGVGVQITNGLVFQCIQYIFVIHEVVVVSIKTGNCRQRILNGFDQLLDIFRSQYLVLFVGERRNHRLLAGNIHLDSNRFNTVSSEIKHTVRQYAKALAVSRIADNSVVLHSILQHRNQFIKLCAFQIDCHVGSCQRRLNICHDLFQVLDLFSILREAGISNQNLQSRDLLVVCQHIGQITTEHLNLADNGLAVAIIVTQATVLICLENSVNSQNVAF